MLGAFAVDFSLKQQDITPDNVMSVIDTMIQVLQRPVETDVSLPIQGAYKFEGKATPTVRQKANDEAVALLKAIKNGDIRNVTPEQKAILSRYTGTGGNLVGDDGLKGSAYEYYTPIEVAESMWELLKEQGFKGGNVLDPSAGTGIFSVSAPKDILMHSVELSDISGGINAVVNGSKKHAVTVSPFEQVAATTDDEIFDAVITNVPFGSNSDRGKNKNLDPKYQKDTLEEYFIKRSLDKLRPNGFATFIVPTKILDNSSFKKFRQIILLRADLLGAYRLPNKVFDATGADVTTDIIVLRKHSRDIAEKIDNLYENGGLPTLQEALVLDHDIIAGRYFKTYGKRFVLGETVTAKGRFGDVEKVVNDDSLANILKLVRKLPDSRINYELLGMTEQLEDVTFNEGDTRQIDGATFELKNGEWRQVIRKDNFDPAPFATPFAMLSAGVDYTALNGYIGYCSTSGKRPPEWVDVLIKNTEKKPESLGFWLCVLSVIDALKVNSKGFAYAKRYTELTNFMIGYAEAYSAQKHKTSNQDYKRYLQSVSVAFDAAMPDGLSRFWHGESDVNLAEQQLATHAAYESAVYRGEADNWQVDVRVIQESKPDFDPMNDPDYCINVDGTKVTLKRDYYVGNYKAFNDRLIAQIEAATDPLIKEKLIRQKQEASGMIEAVDVRKLSYGLMSTTIPIDIKYRYFSEFIEDRVLLDSDGKLELDVNNITARELVYKLSKSGKMNDKMDDKDPELRIFMLNRIFNSINNNQKLSITADKESVEDKSALLKKLGAYYRALNTSFDAWLKSNDAFMAELNAKFNAPENKTFPAILDDSPITIDGFNPKKEGFVSLNGYQNEEIRRLSRSFKGICGFDVGLGKTLTALAAVQNMHNIGIKKRTFFIVPSHTISKWLGDMKMAYDNVDDVLVIGSNHNKNDAVDSKFNGNDFALLAKPQGKQYRKILMTVDAFNMIPLREETIKLHWNDTEDTATSSKKDSERNESSLNARIKKLNRSESKIAYFEDMSVDSLVFDEAQLFKNGKAGGGSFKRITGLSLLAEDKLSARAISAAVKSWYVRGENEGLNDGVLLLTATPFTNSPVEILTMLSLSIGDKEALREFGGNSITNVEDFLSTFTNVEGVEQLNIINELVSTDTFTGFLNAQLLKNAIHKVANIQTARERGLKIPDEDNVTVALDLSDDDQATLSKMKQFYSLAKQSIKGGMIVADEQLLRDFEEYKAMTGETDDSTSFAFNLMSKMSDVILAGREIGLLRIVPLDFDPSQLDAVKKIAKKFNDQKIIFKTERKYPSVSSDLISSKMIKNKNTDELEEQFTVQAEVSIDDHNSRLILNVDDAGVLATLLELVDDANLIVKPKLSAKLQAMVENFKVEQSDPKYQGYAKQLIFCDALAMQQVIKRALMAYAGVSGSKIAIINAQTLPDGKKGSPDSEHMQEVQDKFASNDFIVVIANKKAETGIDLQIGTQAIHHTTTGWTPDSIQQRNGRGVRQGNKKEKVSIYRYNANGTFDEYKVRLISGKSDWIDQLMQKDGTIEGTLVVEQRLSDEDYEDMLNADNPEQIAALLNAKKAREDAQNLAVSQDKTKLLYANMVRAKGSPAPTIVNQVKKIMENDAKKMVELIKKRNKAIKDEIKQGYDAQLNAIADKYVGWFDGDLTKDLIENAIQYIVTKKQHTYSYTDIPDRLTWGGNNWKSSTIANWIEQNAPAMINDVVNRARNIVSTAENMVQTTIDSFMNFADSTLSKTEKEMILSGEAALDSMGVFWQKNEFVRGNKSDGSRHYGYVTLKESFEGGKSTGFSITANGKSFGYREEFSKIEPSEKQAAIEYMVNSDVKECTDRRLFDVDVAKPTYSKELLEIRNLVVERLVDSMKLWEAQTTSVRKISLLHLPTDRVYWSDKTLVDMSRDNVDIMNKYNSVFEFKPSENMQDDNALILNSNLKHYNTRARIFEGELLFRNYIAPYLLANNEKIKVTSNDLITVIPSKLLVITNFTQSYIDSANSEYSEAVDLFLKKGMTLEQLFNITKNILLYEFGDIFEDIDHVTNLFLSSPSFEKYIRPNIKILSDSGE